MSQKSTNENLFSQLIPRGLNGALFKLTWSVALCTAGWVGGEGTRAHSIPAFEREGGSVIIVLAIYKFFVQIDQVCSIVRRGGREGVN